MHYDAIRPNPSITNKVLKTHPGIIKEDKQLRLYAPIKGIDKQL